MGVSPVRTWQHTLSQREASARHLPCGGATPFVVARASAWFRASPADRSALAVSPATSTACDDQHSIPTRGVTRSASLSNSKYSPALKLNIPATRLDGMVSQSWRISRVLAL